MAAKSGRKDIAVVDQLFDPDDLVEFSFFQAVRLLETLAARTSDDKKHGIAPTVGGDCTPEEEPVRFEVLPTLSFPASEIVSLKAQSKTQRSPQSNQPESRFSHPRLPVVMESAFMGLTGPNGAMPYHYTSLIIERLRQNDETLKRFWDLFNHRTIALFYRAWRKYRLAFVYETHQQSGRNTESDDYTKALMSLCGFGTPGLRDRLLVKDDTFLYYAGHFSSDHRSADGLRCILTDTFSVPVEIEQFKGEWLPLAKEYQSCLPCAGSAGMNMSLGQDTIVGSRVWSCQHRFRVRVGPVGFELFQNFMPDRQVFRKLCQIVRMYVGIEFDFDVQLVLRQDEVPPIQVGGGGNGGSRLGWNTWMRSPRQKNHADDAIFRYDGIPLNGRETA